MFDFILFAIIAILFLKVNFMKPIEAEKKIKKPKEEIKDSFKWEEITEPRPMTEALQDQPQIDC